MKHYVLISIVVFLSSSIADDVPAIDPADPVPSYCQYKYDSENTPILFCENNNVDDEYGEEFQTIKNVMADYVTRKYQIKKIYVQHSHFLAVKYYTKDWKREEVELNRITGELNLEHDVLRVSSYSNTLKVLSIRNSYFPKLTAFKYHDDETENLIPTLERLILHNVKLNKIELGAFNKFPNLKFLALSDNNLTTIEPNLFNSLTKLEFLSLQNNGIMALPEDFHNTKHLDYIDLSDNPLIAIDFLHWFGSGNNLPTFINLNGIPCETMKKLEVKDIKIQKENCYTNVRNNVLCKRVYGTIEFQTSNTNIVQNVQIVLSDKVLTNNTELYKWWQMKHNSIECTDFKELINKYNQGGTIETINPIDVERMAGHLITFYTGNLLDKIDQLENDDPMRTYYTVDYMRQVKGVISDQIIIT